ncbi:hypothetical protein, conserved [Babesia ovata]|uniref:Uncharacterized protein n=1 Tax=Babesia ovata TaxID=189622 RepID=A0A2H6KAC9_9APIC|nr:uncharacterized protein BOVATA_014500 [Babesia ovata]GBE59957.1 hypothetical protein, conserved [Babesia ovata]
MSFLHGVLDTVKDDESVTMYDKNHDPNIDKLVGILHNNVGQGRQAFPEAVDKVEKATGGVKDKLGELIGNLSSPSGKYYNQAYDQTDLNGQLHEWTKTLQGISTELTIIETQQINDLDKSLSTRIMHKIEPIQKSVEVLLGAAKEEGLKSKVKEVDDALWKQEQKVRTSVGNLRIEKREKFDIIKKAIKDAQHFMDNGFDWEYRSKILGCFTAIKDAIINAYDSLKQKKNYLDGLVMDAQEHVYQIKIGIGTESISFGDTVYGGWGLLKIEIKKLVGQIKGGTSGLKQIVEGIEAYANGFENEAFSKVLQKWIDEIVNDADEGIVGSKIKNYVTFNQNNGKLSAEVGSDKSKTVRQAIIAELPAFIHGDVKTAAVSTLKNTKVNNIDEQLSAFAARIESELTNDRDSSIGSAVQAIEEKLGLKGVTNNYRQYLTAAVKAIANSIIKNFMQVAEELKRFAKDSHIANLTQIGNNVDNIKKYFDGTKAETINGTTNYGKKIDDALAKVKDEIEALDGLLGVKVGQDGSIQKKLNEIQEELGNLHNIKKDEQDGTIHDKTKEADDKMDVLKTEIKYKLHVIEWNTRDADEALTHAIDEIDKVVRDAFSTLTAEVRALFAQGHKADLAALKTLVEEQEKRSIRSLNMIKAMARINALGSALTPSPAPAVKTQGNTEDRTKLKNVSDKFREYSDIILDYIGGQARNPSAIVKPTEQSLQVGDIKDAFDRLIKYVAHHDDNKYTFDHISTSYLDALNASLHKLSPSHFHGFHNPLLLDALKAGMEKFTEQLSHAYVNKYCGKTITWEEDKYNSETKQNYKVLSTEGRSCAKVCLTILEIFSHDLNELKHQCETNWKNRKICLKNGNGSINDLGLCLKRFGYGVPSREDVQDDELRCSKYMNGNEIFAKLTIPTITERDEYNVISTLKHICDNLLIYYRVCHYSTLQSKTYPSSVYQMLLWLAGLPYNPVYDDLSLNGFGSLLDKPEEQDTDTGDESLSVDVDNGDTDESRITLKDENEESLDAYKEKITVPKLYEALAEACSHAHSVLTSILGHGHAGGIYAVDFNTNEDKFSYPSDMNSLICMLFEIVKRLHDQLYFLYRQCMHDSKLSGWSDCWYGHDIGGTAWKCNTLQCPNQSGDQIANQTHKQTCNQKCNQSVSCGVKSPLQSFLEDGLQGFLPHSLKSERGKLECSVKPHFNLPCKTPMGFSDISHMASHRQTGRHIREALFDVCSGEWSAFSRLCSLLNCLLPSAPKTLDDMFGFYFNLVNGWNKTAKQAFDNAINEANFNRTNARLDISAILKSNDHGSGDNMPHLKGDLHSLVDCKYNGESHPAYPCGPYVQPLCYYRCGIFAAKNNDKYVSWIVYLTESFLELLEKLHEECCKNCDSATSKCKISKCKDDCKAKDAKMSVASTHNGSCNSIVHCNLMRPTMYRCGFVFQSIYKLSGTKSVETKRTCKDFCNALEKVINKDEKIGATLAELIYRTIPNFLWKIREPFTFLLLALWSLSLLYLLHIAVVRLDVLRIRSHLRSPSSHRIAAQSLLAAARVKALANVKYFSP